MANYYTRFACVLPLGNTENVSRAFAVFADYEAAMDAGDETTDFQIENDSDTDGTDLIITSGDGSGDPNQVADFAGRVGHACGLVGYWGFVWAATCDRNRVGGFGGGAIFIDLGTGAVVRSLDCNDWLGEALGSAQTPAPLAPPATAEATTSAHP